MNTSPDIIEDACAFAWVQFMRYQPSRERAWRAWLVTTAEREAWRLHGIEAGLTPFEVTREDGTTFEREPADPRTNRADEHAEAVEALEVLAAIPARRRQAMELHVAGLTYREIADVMGIGPTRVNHLINEANSAIRKERARRDGTDIPRSERASRLHELEQDPPAWLRNAIGRQSRKQGASAMLAWRRAALAIDDYRRMHGHDLGDEALGCRPEGAAAARAFDPLALFFLAQRAYEDSARETRILEEARDEALLHANQRLRVADSRRPRDFQGTSSSGCSPEPALDLPRSTSRRTVTVGLRWPVAAGNALVVGRGPFARLRPEHVFDYADGYVPVRPRPARRPWRTP